MPSTFTPSDVVDMSKEKEWASGLGMMDWDNTRIVFTKRTLIEFLRYTGTTVDTNFGNISKLPKYATFGAISGEVTEASDTTADPEPTSTHDSFRPSRRVRTAPGGEAHDIFGHYVDDDALAGAPPRPVQDNQDTPRRSARTDEQPDPARSRASTGQSSDPARSRASTGQSSQPMSTRDNIASLWDTEDAKPAFKPTRRVRDVPGGRDSIADIL